MPKPLRHFRWQQWPVLLVFIVAVAVYLNALQNGYAMDDGPIVQTNWRIRGFSHLRDLLLGPYWPNPAALYRPLVLLSFATEWTLFGDNPAVFHAVNVILHALVTASVYLLLTRLGAAWVGALAGALLFAVHPVHVEAVANIVGRAEMLAALFFLLACHLHLTRSLGRLARVAGITVCYLLALGAKEIAVTLPAVLLLLDAFRDPDGRLDALGLVRKNLLLLSSLTAALVGYMALRIHAIGEATGAGAAVYLSGLSLSERLATAVRIWPEFARLLFWPQDLAAEWGPAVINPATWSHPLVWVGLVLGAALAVLTYVAWPQQRWVSLAILWFAIIILPVSHLLFPVGVMLAERTLYLPSVAVALLVPAVAAWLPRRAPRERALAVGVLGIALGLGAWRTWHRTPVWESNSAMARALIWEHPTSYRTLWLAGSMMVDQGRHAEAVPLFEQAVELTGEGFYPLTMELARTLITAGQAEKAEALSRRAIQEFTGAGLPYLTLSEVLLQSGRYSDALDVLRQGYTTAADTSYHRLTFAHNFALTHDGLKSLDSALVWRQRSMQAEIGSPLYQEWYHLARLRYLFGQPHLAGQALDSARAAAPAAVRDSLILNPLPEPNSPLLRGWSSGRQ